MNRDKTIIEHLIVHAEKICIKMCNVTLEQFLENDDLKDIICFNLPELLKILAINSKKPPAMYHTITPPRQEKTNFGK